MIAKRSPKELETMRRAGLAVCDTLQEVAQAVRPGVSTWELEEIADRGLKARGAVSAFRGYHGYPCVLCVSVNEQVIHGIPSRKRILQEGEMVSLDCGVVVDGYYADHAITVPVGDPERVPAPQRRLLQVATEALDEAIGLAQVGRRLGDISEAVQRRAEHNGFGVVREFVGHGIGTHLHEDPQVPNFGTAGTGPKLKAGMVLCIEPMFTQGEPAVRVLPDGWTAVTSDGAPSVHVEHTVAVTENGPWVLTRR